MSEAPAAAKQKKWYDPTYCGGMSPEEIDVFLGSPDSAWLCRLAVLKEDGWPFVTPMWYQWRDGAFYVVGRKRSAWVQDLIRDPRCFVCIDEEATPPAGGLRKVLARCKATVVEGPVVAEGSQWVAGRRTRWRCATRARPAPKASSSRTAGSATSSGSTRSRRDDDVAGRRLGEALPRPEQQRASSRR